MLFKINFLCLSLLQKLTTERTENTEHKELMSKRILLVVYAFEQSRRPGRAVFAEQAAHTRRPKFRFHV